MAYEGLRQWDRRGGATRFLECHRRSRQTGRNGAHCGFVAAYKTAKTDPARGMAPESAPVLRAHALTTPVYLGHVVHESRLRTSRQCGLGQRALPP